MYNVGDYPMPSWQGSIIIKITLSSKHIPMLLQMIEGI